METILQINRISKAYGPVQALSNLSLDIPKGAVFGILGPNGSGKTTLLGILLDVLKADQGSYHWENYPNACDARKHIGSLLETPNFYHYMSAHDNLRISASVKGRGMHDIDRVLQAVSLYERRFTPFSTFSLGMKQRLAIAAALLADPAILLLDEPTNGLDPVGISEIRQLIRELNEKGITIIMASHLLDEVEKVCTHVAILKKGELLSSGPVGEVLNDEDWIELAAASQSQLIAALKQHPDLHHLKEEKYVLASFRQAVDTDSINRYCFEHGIVLNHLQKKKRSLESKFMEITN